MRPSDQNKIYEKEMGENQKKTYLGRLPASSPCYMFLGRVLIRTLPLITANPRLRNRR